MFQWSWPSAGKAAQTPAAAAGVSCRRGLWFPSCGDVLGAGAESASSQHKTAAGWEPAPKLGWVVWWGDTSSSGRVGAPWAVAGVYPPWLQSAPDGCGCFPTELRRAAQLWCSWKDYYAIPGLAEHTASALTLIFLEFAWFVLCLWWSLKSLFLFQWMCTVAIYQIRKDLLSSFFNVF